VYIGDRINNRVRKVTVSTGIITTIAGTGSYGYSGDNLAATSATLSYPDGVAIDTSGTPSPVQLGYWLLPLLFPFLGNVYIADQFNARIRKVTVSTGIITTLAGTGASSYTGDNGPATAATFYWPNGVALDSTGD